MKLGLNLFVLVLGAILFATSCGDDCGATTLSETVIGEWELELNDEKGEVEFLAGGALSDPDDILIGGSIGGVDLDEKSYTVTGDNIITVRAESGNQFLELELDVDSYECDKIILNFIGVPIEMKRK